ncbi:unnamed protein product [Boreogadus saida]
MTNSKHISFAFVVLTEVSNLLLFKYTSIFIIAYRSTLKSMVCQARFKRYQTKTKSHPSMQPSLQSHSP